MKDLLRTLNNIIHGWYYYIVGKNKSLYNERMKVCRGCPLNSTNFYKEKGIEHCTICSCPLNAKLRVPDQECPHGLWSKAK